MAGLSVTTMMQSAGFDVPESMLSQHGAASEEVAIAMATGACEKYGADYGLSATKLRRSIRWQPSNTLEPSTLVMPPPLECGRKNSH